MGRHLVVQVIKTEQKQDELWELTEEGREIVQNGSHEVRIFEAVDPSNGTPQNELMVNEDFFDTYVLCSAKFLTALN